VAFFYLRYCHRHHLHGELLVCGARPRLRKVLKSLPPPRVSLTVPRVAHMAEEPVVASRPAVPTPKESGEGCPAAWGGSSVWVLAKRVWSTRSTDPTPAPACNGSRALGRCTPHSSGTCTRISLPHHYSLQQGSAQVTIASAKVLGP
jgi:hypothetical protein